MIAVTQANGSKQFVCRSTCIFVLSVIVAVGQTAFAQNVDAHTALNPIASIISVPFQNNVNFGVGADDKAQDVLILQPVIPFRISKNWNLVSRWITPLVVQPRLSPSLGSATGLGNMQPQFYLTPAYAGKFIWGAGPQFFLPTAGGNTLGVNKWGGGPALAALTIQGPWIAGALVNNVWAGSGPRRVNQLTFNPFVYYNFSRGWYLISSPVMTEQWAAKSGNRLTVPLGGGFGRLFRIDRLPANARMQVFRNAVRPDFTAGWTAQFQIQFLFPRGTAHRS